VQQLLDAMPDVPAFVQSGRLDILATNRLGRALYSQVYDQAARAGRTGRLPNHARFTFLDPGAPDFYPDWGRAAAATVALLRAEAGRNPTDSGLTDLVGELTTRSETFSSLWATHNVRWPRQAQSAFTTTPSESWRWHTRGWYSLATLGKR
jgi:hypothetical protein